jgi:hypothetical protein
MKTLKIAISIIVIAVFTCGNFSAQTYQTEMHGTFDGIYVLCGLGPVSGELTAHLTYHLNSKTGKIDNMHFNIPKCEIWNTVTLEKYKLVDVGNDNLGVIWDFFNNINFYNGSEGIYYDNITDGWLTSLLPSVFPSEGSYVEMSFKFIAEGKIYRYAAMYQYHQNANGQITVDKYKENIVCP